MIWAKIHYFLIVQGPVELYSSGLSEEDKVNFRIAISQSTIIKSTPMKANLYAGLNRNDTKHLRRYVEVLLNIFLITSCHLYTTDAADD